MKIAVDFDGTCVTHAFPLVGADIGAAPVLKKLIQHGHKIILNTMRSDGQKYPSILYDALKWFENNGIVLYDFISSNNSFLKSLLYIAISHFELVYLSHFILYP